MRTRSEIEARLAELKAANEAATSWGAAVGARHEEIKELEGRLEAMKVDEKLHIPPAPSNIIFVERAPFGPETYLGDGLYASFNGDMYQLRAPRFDTNHVVYLDPDVLNAFTRFVKSTTPTPDAWSSTPGGDREPEKDTK